jgi:hypothetical protein
MFSLSARIRSKMTVGGIRTRETTRQGTRFESEGSIAEKSSVNSYGVCQTRTMLE